MAHNFNVYRNGKIHVCSRLCSTCIFHEESRMSLHEGRRDQMVRDSISENTAIVCHSTLGKGNDQAVCRGFFERHKTPVLMLAEAMQVVEFQEVTNKP